MNARKLFALLALVLLFGLPTVAAAGDGSAPYIQADSDADVTIAGLIPQGEYTIVYREGGQMQVPTNEHGQLWFEPQGQVWALKDHCPENRSEWWASLQDDVACWFAYATSGPANPGGPEPETGFGASGGHSVALQQQEEPIPPEMEVIYNLLNRQVGPLPAGGWLLVFAGIALIILSGIAFRDERRRRARRRARRVKTKW